MMSLPGAMIIVASQIFSSMQSSDAISKEITKFRQEFQQSIVDRETFFVRKTEISSISRKIDHLNFQVAKINTEIKKLKRQYYTSND